MFYLIFESHTKQESEIFLHASEKTELESLADLLLQKFDYFDCWSNDTSLHVDWTEAVVILHPDMF